MAKRKFTLTPTELAELRAVYHQSQDDAFNKKLLAVQLYGTGHPVRDILAIVQCSRASLMGWCRSYEAAGIEKLRDQRAGGNHYRLTAEQKAELADLVRRYTPKQLLGDDYATQSGAHWTTHDLKQLIARKFEVIYRSHSTYWLLLTEFGLSYQRTETVYKSRSALKVAEFEEDLEKN